jgi:hypothetical protein
MKRAREPTRSPLLFPLADVLWNKIIKPHLSLLDRGRLCQVSYNHQMLLGKVDDDLNFYRAHMDPKYFAEMAKTGSDDACLMYAKLSLKDDTTAGIQFVGALVHCKRSVVLLECLKAHIPYMTDLYMWGGLVCIACRSACLPLLELLFSGPKEGHILTRRGALDGLLSHLMRDHRESVAIVLVHASQLLGEEVVMPAAFRAMFRPDFGANLGIIFAVLNPE